MQRATLALILLSALRRMSVDAIHDGLPYRYSRPTTEFFIIVIIIITFIVMSWKSRTGCDQLVELCWLAG